MNQLARLGLIAAILAAALLVPMAAADVVFIYKVKSTMKPLAPVNFTKGPDASEVQLSVTNGSNTIVSFTVPVANATEIYVYQALKVYANNVFSTNDVTLYVASCSYTSATGSPPNLNEVELVVYPTSGSPKSPTGTITITPPSTSSTSCSTSGSVTLTPGTTYYVDIEVVPSLPTTTGPASSWSSGVLTLYFAFSNGTATPSVPVQG